MCLRADSDRCGMCFPVLRGKLYMEVNTLSEMLPKYVFPFCRPFLKKGLMLETVINKGNIYTVSQNLPVTL